MPARSESELIAQQLSTLSTRVEALESRVSDVDKVIDRLGRCRTDDGSRLAGNLVALGRGL